jgi:hypothetical protein
MAPTYSQQRLVLPCNSLNHTSGARRFQPSSPLSPSSSSGSSSTSSSEEPYRTLSTTSIGKSYSGGIASSGKRTACAHSGVGGRDWSSWPA